jgi:hypothetical protein
LGPRSGFKFFGRYLATVFFVVNGSDLIHGFRGFDPWTMDLIHGSDPWI